MELVETLPGYREYEKAWQDVLHAAAANRPEIVEHFGRFTFTVSARGNGVSRKYFRGVPKWLRGRCSDMAALLGLEHREGVLVTIALAFVLVFDDDVPDVLKREMLRDLRLFRRELRRRADRACELRDRVLANPERATLRITLTDILEDDEEDG